ncbi:MAG TPA: hypothetical protein PK771_15810, partial [Spirochaetota bacterium]|nr:hypothetical protein [Spirochaetota bacterium]
MKKISVLLFALFFTFSCILESDNPLSDLSKAYEDKEFCGLWKFLDVSEKEDINYLLILKTNNNIYQLTLFDKNFLIEEDGVYNAFITKIGNETFLNIKPYKNKFGFGENEDRKSYFFMHYKITANFMQMAMFDNKFIVEAIEKGKLKGEVDKYNNY